jgi:hypothetical protein
MKTVILALLSTLALSALVVGPAVMAAEPNPPAAPTADKPANDGAMTCPMQGTTPEGTKAMRELMQSPKGAQAMNNMMEMAQRMGNGDPMLGMTKMMEMMGGQGGMMGGGMMGGSQTPAPQQPK